MKWAILTFSLLILTACGGGGSGGATSDGRSVALPSHLVLPPGSDLQRENTAAHDPLDHWYRTEPAVHALNLDTGGTTSAIRPLLDAAGGDANQSATRLRNINASSLTPIGLREGIAYGQWMAGPAGTLDIDFNWQFAEAVPSDVRTAVERAAKFWSRRLLDHFDSVTFRDLEFYDRGPIEVETDDLTIIVQHWTQPGQSSAAALEWNESETDFEPVVGNFFLAQGETIEDSYDIGHFWLVHIAAHEVGHILGHDFAIRAEAPSINRFVNDENHTFNGPKSVAEHGGPVPFQWLDPDRRPVPTGTGTVDYGHLGPCGMVMSYANGICGSARNKYEPNELDFAFMDDIGWDVLDANTARQPEVYGYGAWAEHSAWGVGVERILGTIPTSRDDIAHHDWLQASADAFGTAPDTLFVDAFAGQTGAVTWSGSLLGVDTGRPMLPPVFGNAELDIQLATLEGTARFDELTSSIDEELRPFRVPSLTYDVTVVDNGFADPFGVLGGGFFGPAHDEMAGTLDDPQWNLLAGFGGVHQDRTPTPVP